MKSFRFKKIDAFATKKSGGNPAGYIQLAHPADIDQAGMLKIAKELKGFVNEVGYVYQTQDDVLNLKFYSSEREVDFCGHATIAILYDLIEKNDKLSLLHSLKINTNKGTLTVENRVKTEGAVFIMSPSPTRLSTTPPLADIAQALRMTVFGIDAKLPVRIINAGLNTLIVPIQSLKDILSIQADLNELKEFCFRWNIDIIEVFTNDTTDGNNDYRTRVFAPTFGYLEDPATGSGNSALGYYLRENGLWNTDTLVIEQNGLADGYNIVKLQAKKDTNGVERIWFGGGAITRIEGEYSLY
jgi:PhzF family phenazine biosynthesis protein